MEPHQSPRVLYTSGAQIFTKMRFLNRKRRIFLEDFQAESGDTEIIVKNVFISSSQGETKPGEMSVVSQLV